MDKNIIQKLGRLCDSSYPRTERPMSFTVDGEVWTFATDGVLLVGVKADKGFPEPSFKKFETAIESPDGVSRISFQALKDFVDCPPVWDDEGCDFCAADIAPRRPAYINDYVFSRELLARIIDTVPTQPEYVAAGVNTNHLQGAYLFLRADDWMASLMAMRNITYPDNWEMPRFTL